MNDLNRIRYFIGIKMIKFVSVNLHILKMFSQNSIWKIVIQLGLLFQLLFLCGMFILIGPEMRLTEEVLQGIYLKCFKIFIYTEAEYIVLFEEVREALWLKSLTN